MTVKLSKAAGNQYYYISPTNSAYTLPQTPTPFTLSWVITFDGDTTSTTPQYIFSTGNFGEAGSFHVFYTPSTGIITMARNTSTSSALTTSGAIVAGQSYRFALVQEANGLTMYRCPILATEPVDGSAVTNEGTASGNPVALLGAAGVYIGARGDVTTTRMFDNSIGRVFFLSSALTTLEIAQLAYGKTILQIGKTPVWHLPLETVDDFQAPFAKSGTPVTSTAQPAYGYSQPATPAPTISGTPTLNTTPTVGVAVGYTPASVTGTSTRTQQWTLDGVDIAGATADTYTPVSGDATKALRVRQIQTNAGGTASATSAPSTVSAASSDVVTGVAMPAERIYQRSGTTLAIPMSGTYTGTVPTSIEYQLYAENGTTVLSAGWLTVTGATISGGTWSGTATVPQGGMYRRQVRAKSGTTVIATGSVEAELFGVGDLHAWIGSSSAANRFTATSATGQTPAANVRVHTKSGGWAKFGTVGIAIKEANGYASQSNVPIGMLGYGVGGTTLATWNTASAHWNDFVAAVALVGGKLASTKMTVGSNDASAGTVVDAATHATNLRTLISRVRTATGQPSLPIMLSGMNRRVDPAAVDDSQANYVHMAENAVGNDADVTHVQTLDVVIQADGTHPTIASGGYPAQSDRYLYQFGTRLYGGGAYLRGPLINPTGATFTGDTLSIPVTYRNGTASSLAPTVDFTGFLVTDANGTPGVVSSTMVAGVPTIKFDRALVAPVSFSYIAGSNPAIAGQLFDNGPTPLPTTMVTGLTAAAAGTPPTTGTFTSAQLTTSDTIRNGHTCYYEWHAGGVIGTTTGTITYGSKALTSLGVLAVTGLPLGSGYMLMKFTNGGVACQEGSVA